MTTSILYEAKWPATALEKCISTIDVEALAKEYACCVKSAPRRSSVGKKYFVCHAEKPPAKNSNRHEEHCAVKLRRMKRHWPRKDGGWFKFLDYQVPLKARQSDKGIGKIDLLGVTDQGRLIVHELKVKCQKGNRGESPPAALMQGLRYAAIVQANIGDFVRDAEQCLGCEVSNNKPIVQVLANSEWWEAWHNCGAAGNWCSTLADISVRITKRIGIPIEYAALKGSATKPVLTYF
ncbi:MAG: hypothetical protein ACR2P9_02710 [Gammaproteobacteria bacterium]